MPSANRRPEPELMDDPELEREHLHGALSGLARLNSWSLAAPTLWKRIKALNRRRLSLLDVATGSGDIPAMLLRSAAQDGIDLRITACDINAESLRIAAARLRDSSSLRFYQCDVRQSLPAGEYDVVMCSLFLHHLETTEARQLLRRMSEQAKARLLVSDLLRTKGGLLLAYAASRALTRSPVVHSDAVRSVQNAFSLDELRALAAAAGLDGAVVSRCWPCRALIEWSPQ